MGRRKGFLAGQACWGRAAQGSKAGQDSMGGTARRDSQIGHIDANMAKFLRDVCGWQRKKLCR